MGSLVTVKLFMLPLLSVTSLGVKPVGASLKVNVTSAVSPLLSVVGAVLVMSNVGAMVSSKPMDVLTVLCVGVPLMLPLSCTDTV